MLLFSYKIMFPQFLCSRITGKKFDIFKAHLLVLELVTDNDWINIKAFLKQLQFFLLAVRPTYKQKVLLIFDINSVRNFRTLDYAPSNNMFILPVPTYTTHRLQSLDVTVYLSLNTAFKKPINK